MRHSLIHKVIWLLMAALVTTFSTSALAQPTDEDQGKALAREAMGHYKENEFAEALQKFEEASAVYPTGQVLRMRGYTLMAMERWVEAAAAIEQALAADLKPLLPRDAEHAEDNLRQVLTHVGQVEVVSTVAGARVSIDGGESERLPAKMNVEPGRHNFVVTADEHDAAEMEKDVEAGQKLTIELDPIPITSGEDAPPTPTPRVDDEPEEESEPLDIFGWFPYQGPVGLATAGVGAALAVAGLATGMYGSSLRGAVQENIDAHNANYDANCSQNTDLCLSDISLINRDGQHADELQTTGLGLGITGAALFATGAILFLFSDDSPLAGDETAENGDSLSLICAPSLNLAGDSMLGCLGRF